MGQRHKHADVIIAWAEGKDVQVRDEGTKRWYDVGTKFPIFNEDREHRIKPPDKKYRVTLKDDPEDKFTWVFECMAENADHAEEQAENAYPDYWVMNTTLLEGE